MRATLTTLSLAAMATTSLAAEPATYRCERLLQAWTNATDMNGEGVVAGTYKPDRHDSWHAAVWRNRRPETLANPAGMESGTGVAYAINRLGDLAGSVSYLGHERPFSWLQGMPTELPQLTDAYGANGRATDLNAHGQAVGFSTNSWGIEHAVVWKNGKVMDLGALAGVLGPHKTTSRANAINATGTIVGRSDAPLNTWHAVQWTGGRRSSLVDLGASAYGFYSEAAAINRDGVVVGVSSVDGEQRQLYRPIGWNNGTVFDLKAPAGATGSRANDINDAGTVVGSIDTDDRGALVWPHYGDEPIDLKTLLDADGCRDAAGHGYRLTHGIAVNERGQILAGSFELYDHFESFRLTPR
jgi:probable HAF family extracellular repeat protein